MVTLIEIILQQWNDKTGKHQRIEGIIIDNLLAAMSTVHLKSGNHFRRSRYLLTRGFFWCAWSRHTAMQLHIFFSATCVNWLSHKKRTKIKGRHRLLKKKSYNVNPPCHNATFCCVMLGWSATQWLMKCVTITRFSFYKNKEISNKPK